MSLDSLHDEFGIEIKGLDLSTADAATFSEVELAAEQYSLLLLRDQSIDDEKQMTLTRRFGEPEFAHIAYGRDGSLEYIGHIGNVDNDGKRLPSRHKDVVFGAGNYLWHSDSSFRPVPSKYSISYAYEVTPEGGELEFVSIRSAYRRLSEETRVVIDGLVGVHDYVFSRSKVAPVSASLAATLPPVRQRLVRTNPVTHEKNYYVGSHLKTIEGWDDSDSRVLIDDLIGSAVEPEHIYQHQWQVGDLLIWDNRCLLHRGSAYDADRYRRRMHQTRVVGAATLEE